ncbi:MAG: FAD-binding oxidoreductase [Deltaproteobacteria bacterium]|nr:FAD-binding oxidoreductase [Deltaproteobacteria bacterium]MBW2359589.1 FAD-binding oxidoreductase [Deltaproteobacteria bacterium]
MTAPSDALLQALERVAGADALAHHTPELVDDCAISLTLRPPDAAALGRCLEVLSDARTGVVVRGGASRLGLGNVPRAAALLLDTRGLAGVESFEPAEGVCRAGAGTPLSVLREKVRAGGWELPLDPPGAGSTLGGAIASGAFGPRAQGYGMPRDAVLGLDVALATGARTRCGGRVVKNVTGYDLCKLYTGSFGALGVLEAAWLRLCPLPQMTVMLEARPDDLDAALRAALAASRRATARAVALHAPAARPGAPLRSVVELAGDSVAVEDERAALCVALEAEEVDPSALDELRAQQAAGELVVRVSALATRLGAAAAALRKAGAELLIYPGLGVLYASFAATTANAFSLAVDIAVAAGGAARLERAPAALKREVDVFGELAAALPLQRALKVRFDPVGVLNPGRSAGRL